MYPIDVHILRSPGDDPVLYDRMMKQLAAEPVNVHEVPGVANDIGTARRNGYAAGSAPYVTYVDPDDTITPGVFSRLNAVTATYPNALIAVNENVIVGDAVLYDGAHVKAAAINFLHHLIVYRRELLADELLVSAPNHIGVGLNTAVGYWLQQKELVYLDYPGYNWVRHEASYSHQRRPIVDVHGLEKQLLAGAPHIRILSPVDFDEQNNLVGSGVRYKIRPLMVGLRANVLGDLS